MNLVQSAAAIERSALVKHLHDSSGNADHRTVCRNLLQNHASCRNPAVVADLEGAKNLGACSDQYVVAERRMALAGFLAGAAEGCALINHAVVADDGRFTDDDAGTVVDENAAADLCGRVDFDTGCEFRQLRDRTGEKRQVVAIEPVGAPVASEGVKPGIEQKDFKVAPCGRVNGTNPRDVRFQLIKHVVFHPFENMI